MAISHRADEALRFAAGYFNEDWGMDYASWSEAIAAFVAEQSGRDGDLALGFEELLALDDVALAQAVDSWGIPDDPRLGASPREFVKRLLVATRGG